MAIHVLYYRVGTASFPPKTRKVARSLLGPALACAKSVVWTDSPQETRPLIQPMIPAHDGSKGLVLAISRLEAPQRFGRAAGRRRRGEGLNRF